MQKNQIGLLSQIIYKNKLKWIEELNVRPETIKLQEENTGSTHSNTDLSSIFKYVSSGKAGKNKNKQMKLHQTKKICTAKEAVNKVKSSPIE